MQKEPADWNAGGLFFDRFCSLFWRGGTASNGSAGRPHSDFVLF
jgi:hypothetical protein